MSNEFQTSSVLGEFLKADSHRELATIRERVFALIIDAVMMWIVTYLFTYIFSDVFANIIFNFALSIGYHYFFYNQRGTSFGKSFFQIMPVGVETKQPLTIWQNVWRETAGHSISGLILGLGYVMAIFTDQRRALHDFIFKSVVVKF